MHFGFDKKYLKVSIYVIFTVMVIKILDMVINYIPAVSITAFTFLRAALSLLTPVILSLAIAYVLNWPTKALASLFQNKLHIKRKTVCRGLAIVVSYTAFIGIIVAIFLGIYYMIGGKIANNTSFSDIVHFYNTYLSEDKMNSDELAKQIDSLHISWLKDLTPKITVLVEWLQNFLQKLLSGVFDSLLSFGSNLFNLLIAFILSIYILYSADYFLELWDKLMFIIFKDSHLGHNLRRCLKVVNYTFSNYIRGQLIEAFFVAVMISVVLMLLGVDYALVIGIITGILNLIPYIGAFIGVLLATLMGLLTGGGWLAFWALICTEIVQQIDANILCPRIVGNQVGIHPAFILIAITIGGSKWGLLGMILAVPVTASLISLLKIWYRKDFASRYQNFKKQGTEDVEAMLNNPHYFDPSSKTETTEGSTNTTEKKSGIVKELKEDIKDIIK